MSEIKQIRIPQAASKFGVGASHIVDYLKGKGFSVTPASKLTDEQFDLLAKEYQQDTALKDKASHIQIGVDRADRDSVTIDKTKPFVKPKEEEEELRIKTSSATTEVKFDNKEKKKKEEEQEVIKAESKEVISGPKVVDKINLEKPATLVQEEEPKKKAGKATKKKKEEVEEAIEEATKKSAKEDKVAVEDAAKIEQPTTTEVESTSTAEVIETKSDETGKQDSDTIETKFQKLEGTKVLGKIELKVHEPKKPTPADNKDADNKRARKRIPVNKPPGEQGNTTGEKREFRPRTDNNTGSNRFGGNNTGSSGTTNRIGGNNTTGGGSNRFGSNNTGGSNRFGGNNAGAGNRTGTGSNRFGTDNKRFDKNKPSTTTASDQPKEITEQEIQQKIRETQAKLAGILKGGKGTKAKYKRQRREENQAAENEATEKNSVLDVTEFISVSELASLMDVGYTQVISKCMELGVMVSINQRLDAEIIELVASEFGFQVKFVSMEDKDDDIEEVVDNPEDLRDRPPVVTVMGHVDHGKTTLLDFIRKANVAAGEAGGITQHIGAYEVTSDTGKKVVFLDTPGHEAFTAMRARGAKVTDVAVIVIAADDSVMPQTKEAISHAQAAGVPMVFAINKVDKDGANPDRIREQLSQMNILVEEWGGKFQCQEISAKKGQNIDKLLEKILLEAELLELKANPLRPAVGTVIEATLDKGRGYVTTVLVQNGTLNIGDVVVAGTSVGKIKALFSSLNERITITGPSSACTILGLDAAPQAGEKFHVIEDESEAKEIVNKRKQIIREQGIRTKKHITLDEIGRRLALGNFKELNVIIKGDVDGSVEALTDSLLKLSTNEVQIKVVLRGVGAITESDVMLASASDAIIIGFNVRASANARGVAEKEKIEIKYYSIIYNAIEEIKTAMEGMLEPKIEERITGYLEIREVYKITKVGTVAGCFATEGKIYRGSKARIIRDGIVVHTGQLASLKRFKDDAKDVVSGQECGTSLKNYSDIFAGDMIECYEETEIKRKL